MKEIHLGAIADKEKKRQGATARANGLYAQISEAVVLDGNTKHIDQI